MNSIWWSPRFAAVYLCVAVALAFLFHAIGASLYIASPVLVLLVGLAVAVLLRNRNVTAND